MSHHWDDASKSKGLDVMFPVDRLRSEREAVASQLDEIRVQTADTTRFPHGKIGPRDKGQFRYAIAANPTAQIVRVDFGSPVSAIGLTLAEAEEMVDMLTRAVWELRGIEA